ncbi:transposase, partial [Thiolapillus sp.]|uniref:transposase n=1 Tax=Thiolapillus sp. TaxID=2017437 RepID=UPI003AF694E5
MLLLVNAGAGYGGKLSLGRTVWFERLLHISQHLNDAVDSVRRAENKALNKIGDNRLKGSRYCW